jgi:hypothetical protein
MANFAAISSVGKTLERFLNFAFTEEQPLSAKSTRAALIRTEDFDTSAVSLVLVPPALSIYLYRVDFNKTMRAAWSAIGSQSGRAHLALDLHFLITAWAENAEFELRILGRAIQALETNPVMSGPLLDPSGNWEPNETLQVVLEEISTEAVMRTFDSLPADYRLSVPYIARIARMDSRNAQPETRTGTVIVGKTA